MTGIKILIWVSGICWLSGIINAEYRTTYCHDNHRSEPSIEKSDAEMGELWRKHVPSEYTL